MDLLAAWRTNILPDWLTIWLIDWLADWLTGWLTDSPTNWLTDWLTDCLTNWLTDLLTDWMHSWSTRLLTLDKNLYRLNDLLQVSYYHSSKSISGSKNLMYTTIVPRKFKEKVYNRKQWIKFRLLMKRKYATQSGNLNFNNSKKVSKKNGWT